MDRKNEVSRLLVNMDDAVGAVIADYHRLTTSLRVAQGRIQEQEGQIIAQRAELERVKGERDFFQDAHADLVERLCISFNCPNPNAIVEHIQYLFEETQRERDQLSRQLGEAHQALAVAEETI